MKINRSELKIIIEEHSDGFTAYPVGLKEGAIVAQGDTSKEVLLNVFSAIRQHIEEFGSEEFQLVVR